MTKKENNVVDFVMKIIFTLMFISLLSWIYFTELDKNILGIQCKLKALIDDDKYCFKSNTCDGNNITRDYIIYGCIDEFVLRSHSQDKIEQERMMKAQEEFLRQQKEKAACYNSGKDYDYNFTIFGNYNLSCAKIAYLNDHYVDEVKQLNGGYIKGSYSGFVSHGGIEGHLYQYVVVGNLATGKLMKHISYHLDCNNQTSNKVEEYFTKEEFVMTYVDKCIGE